jgi:hypothetical protein
MMDDNIYRFSDEEAMTARQKWRVLRAWKRFIRSGFDASQVSEGLYRFLVSHCALTAHRNRAGFWDFYFDGAPDDLFRLLNQLGGDRRSAEYWGDWWQDGPVGADLKAAMCREMAIVFDTLIAAMDMAARRVTAAQRRRLAAAVLAFEAARRAPASGFGPVGEQLSLWDGVDLPAPRPPIRQPV